MSVIGGSITDFVGALLYPGEKVGSNFAQTQGVNYSGSVWGSTIPISAGYRKVAGAVLWAGDAVKSDVKTTSTPSPFPGVSGTTTTTWTYRQTFAVSLGMKLDPGETPQVRRVWADGSLVWADGVGVPLAFDNGALGYVPTGSYVGGVFTNTSSSVESNGGPIIPGNTSPPTGAVLQPILSNLTFRFYDGSETQLPDPAIVAALGNLAPAYRGQMYMVIDGLVVGTGSLQNDGGFSVGGVHTVPTGFPKITVELVDGSTVTSLTHDFHMLDAATPFTGVGGEVVVMTDFVNRQIAVLSYDPATSGGELSLFDMDTMTQTACNPVTNILGGATIIGVDSLHAWDTINGIIYGTNDGSLTLSSYDMTGRMVDAQFGPNSNLGPRNIDGTTITDAKPCIDFQTGRVGQVEYVIAGGQLLPVLCQGFGTFGVFTPSTSGMIPPTLRPRAFHTTTGNIDGCQAFPLSKKALEQTHYTYQDAAFLVVVDGGTEAGVWVYYVSAEVNVAGGINEGILLGRHQVMSTVAGETPRAMLDQDSNIVVQVTNPGAGTQALYKFAVDMDGPPDYTVAPGWRGSFPNVGAQVAVTSMPFTISWNFNTTIFSDVSTGNFSPESTQLLDLNTLTYTTLPTFPDSDNTAWGQRQADQVPQRDRRRRPGVHRCWTSVRAGLLRRRRHHGHGRRLHQVHGPPRGVPRRRPRHIGLAQRPSPRRPDPQAVRPDEPLQQHRLDLQLLVLQLGRQAEVRQLIQQPHQGDRGLEHHGRRRGRRHRHRWLVRLQVQEHTERAVRRQDQPGRQHDRHEPHGEDGQQLPRRAEGGPHIRGAGQPEPVAEPWLLRRHGQE